MVDLHRKRSDYTSWYASDIVTVTLATGDTVRLFLKDFSSYKAPKDDMRQRRERELRVYRDLLAPADLGTARYYGSVWEEAQDLFWLLLEFVEGQPVRYCDFAYWAEAAAWLGRMQGYFARQLDRLRACDLLIRRDATFFQSTMERALQTVSQVAPEFTPRLLPITNTYERAIALMVNQPITLLHGAYKPEEILLESGRQPPRLCPVDWELAGIGPYLYDLAFFVDGFQPPRLDMLFEAYRREARRAGMSVPSLDVMNALVDCYRLHRTLNRISHAGDRQYTLTTVTKLVDMAAQIGQFVRKVL